MDLFVVCCFVVVGRIISGAALGGLRDLLISSGGGGVGGRLEQGEREDPSSVSLQ
jgi:hypothetical protein